MTVSSSSQLEESKNSLLTRALSRRPTQYSHDVLASTEDVSASAQQERGVVANNVVRNSLMAGSVSGMASTIVLYPMDLVRTSMQAASMGGAGGGAPGGGAGLSGSPLQVLRQTVKAGGIRALYTGIALPLSAQAVYKGTVFSVNNLMEQTILYYKKKNNYAVVELSSGNRLLCGFTAGAVNAGLFVTPVEYVRNQLIAQQAKRANAGGVSGAPIGTSPLGSSWSVIRNAVQVNGIQTLWRGVGITILRDGIGVACFFSAMAMSQQFMMNTLYGTNEKEVKTKTPFAITVASGGCAGLAYWISSLPLDTIKTWVQSADSSAVRVSPVKAIKQIYTEFGLGGLVSRLNRGWQVAYGRGIPSSSITIAVYSYAYQALEQQQSN